ncbi:MAG: response regulator [bacterium]|nr:response regulator [bacterium]
MKKLLILEDEKALRDAYVILFKLNKYEVFEASNGKQALGLLKENKPDIIVLDILMPVMSGLDFLKAVDIKKNYPKSKVLVLSNLSDQKTIEHAVQLGATKYILKASASPSELLAAVKELK